MPDKNNRLLYFSIKDPAENSKNKNLIPTISHHFVVKTKRKFNITIINYIVACLIKIINYQTTSRYNKFNHNIFKLLTALTETPSVCARTALVDRADGLVW